MKIHDPEVVEKTKKLVKELSRMTQEQVDRKKKYLDDQQARFDKGVELAERLSNLANSMSYEDEQRGFMLAMQRTHRTLQQSSFRFMLTWIYYIAQVYTNNDVDGRNEYMVKTAKDIKTSLGDYGYSLPLI